MNPIYVNSTMKSIELESGGELLISHEISCLLIVICDDIIETVFITKDTLYPIFNNDNERKIYIYDDCMYYKLKNCFDTCKTVKFLLIG